MSVYIYIYILLINKRTGIKNIHREDAILRWKDLHTPHVKKGADWSNLKQVKRVSVCNYKKKKKKVNVKLLSFQIQLVKPEYQLSVHVNNSESTATA